MLKDITNTIDGWLNEHACFIGKYFQKTKTTVDAYNAITVILQDST